RLSVLLTQRSIIAWYKNSMPRYAAIDIGSNSIRMLAAEVIGGSPLKTLASSRQVTRLGESVFRGGRVSQSAMDLCSNVLAQMAAEYRAVGVIGVRADNAHGA